MIRRSRKAALFTALLVLVAVAAYAASASSGAGTIKVVYVQGLTGNPFYTTVTCGAAAQAKASGVDFSFQGPGEWSVEKQTTIVNAIVASKPSAIMISAADPKAMIIPLKAAKDAGIKVIMIDGDLADKSIATTNIQSDNVLGGQLGGARLAKLMGGKGSVIALDNEPGIPLTQDRIKGFKNAIKKYPGIKFLGVKYTHNQTAAAANIVSTTASSNSSLTGVFSAETNNSEGAITGVREAKKIGKVFIVGYDTSDPIVAALKKGTIGGAVVQFPYGEGVLGIKSAVAAAAGKPVPRNQGAPFVIATKQNVNTAKVQKFIYSTKCK